MSFKRPPQLGSTAVCDEDVDVDVTLENLKGQHTSVDDGTAKATSTWEVVPASNPKVAKLSFRFQCHLTYPRSLLRVSIVSCYQR